MHIFKLFHDFPYLERGYAFPTKRYCQVLSLKDNPALIAEYRRIHGAAESWAEIREGIRLVGILEMEIYISGSQAFMIVETPLEFEWDKAMEQLAHLPRQQEWEDYVSRFQQCAPGSTSGQKWKLMERIFYLYE